jgi:hypothetical protein
MDYNWCGPVCGGVGREQSGWSVRCGKGLGDRSLSSCPPLPAAAGPIIRFGQLPGAACRLLLQQLLQWRSAVSGWQGSTHHITVWSHSSQAAAGLSQPGIAGAAAALDDGAAANGAWNAVYGRHRQRQQHRVAVAPQACEVYLMRMLLSVAL